MGVAPADVLSDADKRAQVRVHALTALFQGATDYTKYDGARYPDVGVPLPADALLLSVPGITMLKTSVNAEYDGVTASFVTGVLLSYAGTSPPSVVAVQPLGEAIAVVNGDLVYLRFTLKGVQGG